MKEYIVIKPNHGAGMFSFMWETLKILKVHQHEKVYIDFSESIYKKNQTDNAWDYFFEQPCISKKPHPDQIKNVYYSNYVDYLYSFEEIKKHLQYYFEDLITEENIKNRRKEYNDVIKKYCILKPHIQQKITNFYEHNLQNKNVLGVHLRGTDHPYKLNMEKYIEEIKKYQDAYDIIYVSTDEYERYKMVQDKFGSKVKTYNSIKSPTNKPLHNARYPICQETYQSGEDVVIEAHLLAKTNFLLCLPHSNVNYYSIYSNLNLKYATIT